MVRYQHDTCEVLQIDLVYDARIRWHNLEIVKSLLSLAEEGVTLPITFQFVFGID